MDSVMKELMGQCPSKIIGLEPPLFMRSAVSHYILNMYCCIRDNVTQEHVISVDDEEDFHLVDVRCHGNCFISR